MCNEFYDEFEALLNEYLPSDEQKNEKVKGTIVQKDRNFIYFDVPNKPTSVRVRAEEIVDPKIGDEMELMLVGETEDGEFLIGSRRKIDIEENSKILNEKFEKKDILTGKIVKKIKGGYIVEALLHQGFLPNSLSEIPLNCNENFIGKEIEVIIKDIQPDKNGKGQRITFSKRDITLEKQNQEFNNLKIGDIVTGTVKEILDFGLALQIGELRGFVHISEISWKKIENISSIYKVGDTVKAKIIALDSSKKNIKLSIKALTPNPWEIVAETLKIDDVVSGKVLNFVKFGAFIEIADGVEGLVHLNDLTWNRKKINLEKFMKIGDCIQVKVLEFNPSERKLKLGIKQLSENPWDRAEEKFGMGKELFGKVIDIKPFGIFVQVEEEVDVFIHQSDFSWRGEEQKKFNIGDSVMFRVIELDISENKIKGSVKVLTKSPWEEALERYKVGQTIEKPIKNITEFGLFVPLHKNIDGFIPTQLASKDFIKKLDEKFSVGDVVKAQIVEIDNEKERIKLSIKKIELEEEKRENQELLNKYGTSSSEI